MIFYGVDFNVERGPWKFWGRKGGAPKIFDDFFFFDFFESDPPNKCLWTVPWIFKKIQIQILIIIIRINM